MTDKRPCTKDKYFQFPCDCDECSRQAAHAWTAYYHSDDFQVGVIPPEFRQDFDGSEPVAGS